MACSCPLIGARSRARLFGEGGEVVLIETQKIWGVEIANLGTLAPSVCCDSVLESPLLCPSSPQVLVTGQYVYDEQCSRGCRVGRMADAGWLDRP